MKSILGPALALLLMGIPKPACPAQKSAGPDRIPIRLVLIDEKTELSVGPLPWPRSRHAEMIRLLSRAGARAIVLRMYFRDRGDEEADRALTEEAAASGRVYVEMSKATDPEPGPMEEEWLSRMGLAAQGKPPRKTIKLKYAQLPFNELAEAVRGVGSVDILLDRDGTLKGMPMFVKYRDRLFPSLALRIYLDIKGETARPVVFENRKFLRLGPRRLALDKYGCSPVTLSTGHASSSFIDVLKGRVKPGVFKNAIVIISPAGPEMRVPTAAGSRNAADLLADQLDGLVSAFDQAPSHAQPGPVVE